MMSTTKRTKGYVSNNGVGENILLNDVINNGYTKGYITVKLGNILLNSS